jgi:hypothetical protein
LLAHKKVDVNVPADQLLAGRSITAAVKWTMQGLLARHVAAGIRKDEPSNEDLKKLEHWTWVAHSRRGLEHSSIPGTGHQRIQTRKASEEEIVKFQHSVGPHFDPDEKGRNDSNAIAYLEPCCVP